MKRITIPSPREVKVNRRQLIKSTLLAAGAVSAKGAIAESVLSPQEKGAPALPPEATIDRDQEAYQKEIAHRKNKNQKMPNILWICTDQQRADTIAGLGNPRINTPNLDALMKQSVTFTNAFCQTPICSPSRGSFMTGRYPRETNIKSNAEYIRPTEKLVSRILADQGYDCGLAGKLHLSPCDHKYVEKRIDDGYRVFEWSHDISDNWPGKTSGVTGSPRKTSPGPKPPRKAERWASGASPWTTNTPRPPGARMRPSSS